jgi:hypothetical protein
LSDRRHTVLRRLGWFVALWAGGVVTLAAAGYALRLFFGL